MAFSFKSIHFLHFLPLLIFFQCLYQLVFYIFPQLFWFQYRHIRGEVVGGHLVGVDRNGHRFLCFVRKHHILAEQIDHIADHRPTDPEHRPAVAAGIHFFTSSSTGCTECTEKTASCQSAAAAPHR